MTQPAATMVEIRDDFDRLARLGGEGWCHNSHYHPVLLRQLPDRCGVALDVGCGAGDFARLLARRADRVLALDLSPGMIDVARMRSAQVPNIEFRVDDVADCRFPAGGFDAIASIATLHHLPFAATLARLASWLKPGGTLAVLDLYERRGMTDRSLDLIAVPTNVAWRLAKRGRLREGSEVRRAWAEHGAHDRYMRFPEIRRIASEVLPGSSVRRHLLWRHSLAWRKPASE